MIDRDDGSDFHLFRGVNLEVEMWSRSKLTGGKTSKVKCVETGFQKNWDLRKHDQD